MSLVVYVLKKWMVGLNVLYVMNIGFSVSMRLSSMCVIIILMLSIIRKIVFLKVVIRL